MKVLVVGSGARENTMVRKLEEELIGSKDKIYVAPGNGYESAAIENVPINANDRNALADFAESKGVNITFVGPEEPLINGIANDFEKKGLVIVGPSEAAAELEGSKIYSHEFMLRQNIPHPESYAADTPEQALAHGMYMLRRFGKGVYKVDGPAAGKGVSFFESEAELSETINQIMIQNKFGRAGRRALIQKYVHGREASLIGWTDGEIFIPMPDARDYKKQLDGDKGPNTGGMGAYTLEDNNAKPIIDAKARERIMDTIVYPTLRGMKLEGKTYRGIIYFGLFLDEEGVTEYNCRLGDPETQVQLTRLKSSLVDLGYGCVTGLKSTKTVWSPDAAATVVLATQSYPDENYKKHLDQEIFIPDRDDLIFFQAGTRRLQNGKLVNSGGRVLSVTALRPTIAEAREAIYTGLGKDSNGAYFNGMQYRNDVAAEVL